MHHQLVPSRLGGREIIKAPKIKLVLINKILVFLQKHKMKRQ